MSSEQSAPTAAIAPLALRTEQLPLEPSGFYVAQVIDERKDQKAVAYLLPATDKPAQPVDLQGGGAVALRRFIQQGVKRNGALRPVTVRVRECRVTETPVSGTNWLIDGKVAVHLAFEWQRNGKTIPLTSYQGGARYRRTTKQLNIIEPTLRQSLTDALGNFNNWIGQAARYDEKLATGLRITAIDHSDNADADTLFYTPNRPLTYSDFRAQPRTDGGRYGGAVFPSFSYQGSAKLEGGKVHVTVTTKVFVVRSSSWLAPSNHDAYTLNHEQRHFDLVKLVAERFKHKLSPDSMHLDNFNARMQFQYLQSWWEMNRLQEQYDGETGGGVNTAAQERWNQRIDAELRAFKVKQ
ncbi:hypothetical protein [Solirubrum puertoriconensis]|uniref:DUF922 domain-containing protein n=1 Tax=Solirubrum puertoriconensis TaxID=1751427 RepID=A0A9X0HLM1_SOLP1|nr:hypothetical protein [Solirubrum puertoriconensis]KUG08054.1 hypothetical protein ASU33_07570 [Solirubrum puertoriconensis]